MPSLVEGGALSVGTLAISLIDCELFEAPVRIELEMMSGLLLLRNVETKRGEVEGGPSKVNLGLHTHLVHTRVVELWV